MKANNTKKQYEDIVAGNAPSSFSCKSGALLDDDLRRRAAAIDRELFNPKRKIQGGLNTHRAISLVLRYGERIIGAKIERFRPKYGSKEWNDWGDWLTIGGKRMERCHIEQKDLDYAISLYYNK